ncbi:OB-fold-containig protein [Altererythrobacter sp. Root672]|uniref:OB-fold-containig protein n=1 Tax=Altererythrobacter sp. Root672 TaxID=1736584 RepID=UPI0006F56AD4|nr:OB-fold-containig protein [Altererythrobacter sp. Root672]KRA84580.1 hypothetical protein ASD76_02880 [Altererythrobacter sp. Root672]
MSLLADHNLPFAVALALMLLLALLQGFGLGDLFGDHDLDADHDGGLADGLLLFFGIGRVPFLAWLASLLLLFAGIGVGIQSLADSLLGAPLDTWLAAILAAVAALPVTGIVVRPLAHILPGDETTAVSLDSLVGRRATIVTGRASAGNPARARVADRFGRPHHVMVEPHEAGSEMLEGDELLLVRRENETFYGVALQERRLSPV